MAACTIFDEDEVCIPSSSGGFKYGLVVESSEYISSDEEDDEYENKVQKGTVKVAWHPSGDENVVVENTLILADRSLMPGDVVRRLISEKDSQRGFVESISAKCHVKILGTDQWIYNVDVEDIATLQEWDTESEVTLDSWVGQLYEIREDVTVKFPDGARCVLKDAGMLDLEDTNDKRSDHSEFVIRSFYPGQELVGSQEDYESAEWLHTTRMRGPDALGAKPLYQVPVIVEKVEVSGVDVRWLCKGFTRAGSEKDALDSPPRHVEGDQLKRLKVMDCFKHCHHQIGDKGYYVVKETDTILKGMSPRQHYTPDIIQKLTSDNNITIIGTRKDGFVIAKKEAKKLSETSNGPVENGVETNAGAESQIVDNDIDENDGDDESEDVDDDEDDNGEDRNNSANNGSHGSPAVRNRNRKRAFLKSGKSLKKLRGRLPKKKLKLPERMINPGDKVPIEIFYTFSSCRVMWQDGTAEDDIPSPELFPIHHLDEFEYFPGDFVVDAKGSTGTDYGVIVSCDHKERTCMVRWMKPYFPGKSHRPEEGETIEMSVYDIKDHPDYKFRPGNTVIRVGGFEEADEELEAVGQVYRLDSDGSVHIWWPNNSITKTYPQDLFLITDDMSGVNSSDDWSEDGEEEESEAESDVSWETEGEESTDAETDDDKGDESKSQNKPIWTCDDEKKKDLDELLGRLRTAISGLLDIFQNVSGPFFKNSKLVFQDILEIFKKCKEMEKLTKSSFFKSDGICELMAEIKEELRKENTTKLAKHVASMYKYRNSHQYSEINNKAEKSKGKIDDILSTKEESDETKAVNGDCKSKTSGESKLTSADAPLPDETAACLERTEHEKDENVENNEEITHNIITNARTVAHEHEKDIDVETETLEGAVGTAGDTGNHEKTTEQKLKQALIDYGTHIEDPILQIIFDTSLHLAVAKSAKNQIEATSAAGDLNISECQETGDYFSNAVAEDVKLVKSANEESVNDIIESDPIADVIQSAIISLCPGDGDSAEVAALKNSAKRKVKEICSRACDESVGTQTSGGVSASTQTQTAIKYDANGEPYLEQNKEAGLPQFASRDESQDAEADKDKIPESSGNKPEFPTNHRTLCIQVCKALNTQLTRMQQELHRKWLTYKFGCDENATDFELYEAIQGKLIESHEKNGRPLALSDLPGGKKETDTGGKANIEEDLKENKFDGEKVQISEGQPDKSEVVSEDTEGASADVGIENQHKEQSSGFELCSSVSSSHWFKFQEQKPNNIKSFISAVRKELMLLQTSLPQGILVKAFEDRLDLFAVMIYGPAKTPYEDGLFSFDVQLPANFPQSPPMFHYLSYCNERLNPNLYEDGKVCVSLLGTWSGKGSEMWTAKSSLLQVLVSIQGLILVSEPYFNEAGYEKQRGTQQGQENSRMYNEMAVLKLVQSMTKMALTPPAMFVEEARDHLYKTGARMIKRLESWIDMSVNQRYTPGEGNQAQNAETGTNKESHDHKPQSHVHQPESPDQSCDSGKTDTENGATLPDFPLLPASKGFCLTLKKYLDNFKNVLNEHIWTKDIPDH